MVRPAAVGASGRQVGAEDVDPAFQVVQRLAGRGGGGGVVGHQPLIAAVQRGFDHVGVLDVHAQHVGHQAADEGELLVALAEDGLDAFADALALGLQILQQLLPARAGRSGAPWRRRVAR